MIRLLELDIYYDSKASSTETKYANMTAYLLHLTY